MSNLKTITLDLNLFKTEESNNNVPLTLITTFCSGAPEFTGLRLNIFLYGIDDDGDLLTAIRNDQVVSLSLVEINSRSRWQDRQLLEKDIGIMLANTSKLQSLHIHAEFISLRSCMIRADIQSLPCLKKLRLDYPCPVLPEPHTLPALEALELNNLNEEKPFSFLGTTAMIWQSFQNAGTPLEDISIWVTSAHIPELFAYLESTGHRIRKLDLKLRDMLLTDATSLELLPSFLVSNTTLSMENFRDCLFNLLMNGRIFYNKIRSTGVQRSYKRPDTKERVGLTS